MAVWGGFHLFWNHLPSVGALVTEPSNLWASFWSFRGSDSGPSPLESKQNSPRNSPCGAIGGVAGGNTDWGQAGECYERP